MRKLLFVVFLLLLVLEGQASFRVFPHEQCPTHITCKENEILSDEGKCYPCNTPTPINIQCIGHERANQLCPNRMLSYPMIVSLFNCSESEEIYEKDNTKFCVFKCPDGYERTDFNRCDNKITSESVIIDI